MATTSPNYVDVNPSYGTLDDFKQFLDAAHQRNMQVMIELVINHTSDQHPWFKAARLAPPGSPEREMYVWSDTDKLYKDARIIFTDTEKSNWTWDETAQAVLLAPFLLAPAGSELRQSRGDGRGAEGDALLAGHGRGCAAHGRDSVPGRARRDQLREPAGDACGDQEDSRGDRCGLCEPADSGGGEPVAGRCAAVLWRWRRVPHGVPFSADAAHLHGAAAGRPAADHRHHGADAGYSGVLPVGIVPAQSR